MVLWVLQGMGIQGLGKSYNTESGDWISQATFGPDGCNVERAEAMRKRLVAMGTGKDLGYSLEG